MNTMPFEWTVKEFLDQNRISVNMLATEVGGKLSRTSVYKFVDNPSGAKVSSLEVVLDGLSIILKRDVLPNDLGVYKSPSQNA
jgi:hypothetical protein